MRLSFGHVILLGFMAAHTTFADPGPELPGIEPLKDAAVIAGTLSAEQSCAKDRAMVWISKGTSLIYQAEVPIGGTFEFHVIPGANNVIATSASGCFVEIETMSAPNEVKTLEPKLKRLKQASRFSPLDFFIPQAHAIMTSCPQCEKAAREQQFMQVIQIQEYFRFQQLQQQLIMNQMMGLSGFSYVSQMPVPYWAPQGAMMFKNFNYPAPMMNNGISAAALPGGGRHDFGKPNLYFNGADGTAIKARLRFSAAKDSNWLAAIPAHGNKAWSGKLIENQFVSDDGARYPYLFSDYRLDHPLIQDHEGFCAKPNEVVPKMVQALHDLGFKQTEIRDFAEYWSLKLPPSKRYCVYPQLTQILNAIAPLDIEPKPASITRVVFVIQLDEAMDKGQSSFAHIPAKTWTPPKPLDRGPSSQGLQVREWGVGFLTGLPTPLRKTEVKKTR